MFAKKVAPSRVEETCRALAAAGPDKFDGFGEEFSARHPKVADLLSRELDLATASYRALLDGKPLAPEVVRVQMKDLDRARDVLQTESMTAGLKGDEVGATMIQAADLLARHAHASGGNVSKGHAAETLEYVSRQRQEAEEKLNKLGKLARGESILTTEDKLMVALLHVVGVAGSVGSGIAMIAGDIHPSKLAVFGVGCVMLWLGRIALNQARDFALDSLR
jgi:hypothetical protein